MLKKSIFYILAVIGLTTIVSVSAEKLGLLDD